MRGRSPEWRPVSKRLACALLRLPQGFCPQGRTLQPSSTGARHWRFEQGSGEEGSRYCAVRLLGGWGQGMQGRRARCRYGRVGRGAGVQKAGCMRLGTGVPRTLAWPSEAAAGGSSLRRPASTHTLCCADGVLNERATAVPKPVLDLLGVEVVGDERRVGGAPPHQCCWGSGCVAFAQPLRLGLVACCSSMLKPPAACMLPHSHAFPPLASCPAGAASHSLVLST